MTTKTETKTTQELKYPSLYNVILHNDNTTPFEFVISLLIDIFNKPIEEAQAITQTVHEKGAGIAGTFNYEIAEIKKQEAIVITRSKGFQLKVTVEQL